MNCSVKENLDKILERSLGIKEGQQVSPAIQDMVEVKLRFLESQFEIYDFKKSLGEVKNGVLVYNQENLNELENLIDEYEEKFTADFENINSGLVDHFDFVDQTEELETKELPIDPHEIVLSNSTLHSPTFNTANNGASFANVGSINLLEWKTEREELLKKLRDLHTSYLKEGFQKNSEKIIKINSAIQNLVNELQQLDTSDATNVYSSVINEVNEIKTILNSAAQNPVDASISFETSRIKDRLTSLASFFTGKDLLGTPIDLNDPNSPGVLLYEKVKAFLNPQSYLELSKNIEELSMLYEIRVKDIIKGVIENNALVKENMKSANWMNDKYILEETDSGYKLKKDSTGVNILDLLKDYLDKNLRGDVNALSYALGAGTGGGILGDILHQIKSDLINEEIGSTSELKAALDESWQKIKDKKEPNNSKEFLSNRLFRRDVNNVITHNLISSYSDTYFEELSNLFEARKLFYKNLGNETFYKDWMDIEKVINTKIDPRYLQIAKDKYGTSSFAHEFKSEAEIQQYESELRSVLGDTMFEIETGKALQKLSNYVDQTNGGFTYIQEHTLNPFRFLDNFKSTNYGNKDASTAMFLMPDYVHSIPNAYNPTYKNSSFYNSIDNEPELREVWKNLYSALEYTNPFFKSEGIQVNMLELPQYEDMVDREVMKDLSLFGKISLKLKSVIKAFTGSFYDPWFDRKSALRDDTQQGENINVFYTTSPKIAKRKMSKALMQLDNIRLLEELNKEGIQTLIQLGNPNEAVEYNNRKKIADSIAQNRINKTTSTNIVTSVSKMLDIVNNAKARQNTLGIYNLFLDYSRKSKLKGNSYVHDYLANWGEANIVKRKLNDSAKILGIGETWLTKTRLPFKKYYTIAEKETIKIFKELKENKDSRRISSLNVGTYDNPLLLSGTNDNYSIKERGKSYSITDAEAETYLTNYINKEMAKMGVNATVGGTLQGLANVTVKKILSLNPFGGIANRMVGHLANLKLAASKRYGFDEDNLHAARKFLLGTNALKYWTMAKRGINGSKYDNKYTLKKAQDVETVKMFVESLHMLQNKADELALENRFGNAGISLFINNLKDLIVDPNINNPEWHNQTEVILAILNNTMVTDVNGNEFPFFDGKSTIFKPGTLELKDEFNTPENKRMWIDFKYEDGGKNDHVSAIGKISRAKEAGQGNYNGEDISPIQTTLVGKLGTIFLKYLPENTFHNWGYKKIDLRSGIIDYKGSKLELFRHAPTAAAYLGFINAGRLGGAVGTGAILFSALPTLGLSLLPGFLLTGVALYVMRNRLSKPLFASRKEFLLAGDFALEVAKRSANTFARRMSGGYIGLPQSLVDKKLVYSQENLTIEERNLLSESAQDVANKFYVYASYLAMMGTMKLLWLVSMMGADDDDEERLFKIKQIDGALNKLQNIRENINTDTEKFTNPYMFKDAVTSMVFYENTIGWLGKTNDVFNQMLEGKKDVGDLSYQITKAPFIPIPNSIAKMTLTDQGISSLYQDSRVWRNPGEGDKDFIGDKIIRDKGLKTEEVSEKDFNKNRTILRNRAKDEIAKALRNTDQYKEFEVESKTKELTDKFMKKFKKSKGKTYTKMNEDFNLYDEYKRLNTFLDNEVK